MKTPIVFFLVISSLFLLSCGKEEPDTAASIEVLSSSLNGSQLSLPLVDIPREANAEFVFSTAIDPTSFRSALSITGGNNPVDFSLAFSNANTKVTVSMVLAFSTTYNLVIAGNSKVGAKGEILRNSINFSFTTAEDEIIRSMNPCLTVGDCLSSVELTGSRGEGTFEFYANYPIYEEKAEWENLTHALIVVHGASHDPQNYYGYLSNTFENQGISESTILIAPFFRSTATGNSNDFFWANTAWRRGSESSNANKISSFEVVDKLIEQLSDKSRFPVLEKIIITGHSSGAAFTHVYAGASKAHARFPEIDFEYVVANSQFFYYPSEQRVNEATNQLYVPGGCPAYMVWPLGYNAIPPYLAGVSAATYNAQFVSRKISYLIGNGNQADPTLNTTDCENTLQGSSRFKRGDNMFRYMELAFQGTHQHKRYIVNGIGHDGQGMYQSNEFKDLLQQLIN